MLCDMTQTTTPRRDKPRRARRVIDRIRHVVARLNDARHERRDKAAAAEAVARQARDTAAATRKAERATARRARDSAKASAKATRDASVGGEVSQLAYRSLLACTVLVAGVTFVLSFSGLSDYGHRVAGLSLALAWLVPVGVDGLTLCGVAATFLLRHATLQVRLYAWLVFGISVATSVAGNLSHATSRGLTWEGKVGAAAWPILLALASHLVIVTRRAIENARKQQAAAAVTPHVTGARPAASRVTPAMTGPVATVATQSAHDVATTNAPPAPRATPAPRQVVSPFRAPADDGRQQRAHDMFSRGMTKQKIAADIGVSLRTVQRWIPEESRDTLPARHDDASDDTKERSA